MAYPGPPPQYGPGPGMPPPFVPGPPPRKPDQTGLIIGVIIVAVLFMCGAPAAIGVWRYQQISDSPAVTYPTATPRPFSPTTEPTTEPTAEPTGEAPTTAAPTGAVPAGEDITYEGRGDKVVRLKPMDPDDLHFAVITHRGSSNVAIWTLDDGGQQTDLLVNEIGSYTGNRPLDFEEVPAALKVEADGSWKIVVKSMTKAPTWPEKSSGSDPEVLVVREPVDGLLTVKFTHTGKSNFVVYAYGGDYPDLLVNEIGKYNGEVVLPKDTVVVTIEGDGAWTMKKS